MPAYMCVLVSILFYVERSVLYTYECEQLGPFKTWPWLKVDVSVTHHCCMSRDKCNGYLMQVVNAKPSFMNLLECIALWHVAGDLRCDLVTVLKFARAIFALVSYQLRHWSSKAWCSLKLLRINLMFTDRLCFRAYSCHNILFSSVNLDC